MIINAKILDADICIGEHNRLTFKLCIKSKNFSTVIGDYCLDDEVNGKRRSTPYSATLIRDILEVVGVTSWKELIGRYIRIDDREGLNLPILKIGNIIEDKWLDIETHILQSIGDDGV